MNKSEALTVAKKYVDRSTHVHVAADGNVFFEPQKNFAVNHGRKKNVQIFSFTNAELGGKAEQVKKEEPKPEAPVITIVDPSNLGKPLEEYTKNELIDVCNEKGYAIGEYEDFKKKSDLYDYVLKKLTPEPAAQ